MPTKARRVLQPGKYYRFNPPVEAIATPTVGPEVCAPEVCTFDRGRYFGFNNGQYVFRGKPLNDSRTINVPKGYSSFGTLANELRESYFGVALDGHGVFFDPNQCGG